jgi:4-aminobutyrate aminotransferase-like enzyme
VLVGPHLAGETDAGLNLVDMVRCVKYLEIIDSEKLVDNASRMGERLLAGLASSRSVRSATSSVMGKKSLGLVIRGHSKVGKPSVLTGSVLVSERV